MGTVFSSYTQLNNDITSLFDSTSAPIYKTNHSIVQYPGLSLSTTNNPEFTTSFLNGKTIIRLSSNTTYTIPISITRNIIYRFIIDDNPDPGVTVVSGATLILNVPNALNSSNTDRFILTNTEMYSLINIENKRNILITRI